MAVRLTPILVGGETGVGKSSLADHFRRLAHHAEASADAAATLRYATEAAERAALLGAHAQAAAQYGRALRAGRGLDPRYRADLLEHRSWECAVSDQVSEAIAACEQALRIWRKSDERLRQGDALRWLSRLQWMSHRGAESQRTASAAVALLEQLQPGPELARVREPGPAARHRRGHPGDDHRRGARDQTRGGVR